MGASAGAVERSLLPRHAYLYLLLAVCMAVAGCEVTSAKIQQWKGIESGPRKLRTAVRNEDLKLEIRAEAAEALVDLAMMDDLAQDVKELKPASQAKLLGVLVPRLAATAKGSDPAAPPSRKQRNAKDALFGLRDAAPGPQLEEIDRALVAWLTVDLTGRQTAGGHGTAKILKAVGPKAGPALVKLLAQPGPDLDLAARLLGDIGDEKARTQGGELLIELARKEKPVKESTFIALGWVGGPAVVKLFGDLIDRGGDQGDLALRALERKGAPRSESLPLALRAAQNRKHDERIRHDGLNLAALVGGRAAGEGVAPIIEDPDYAVAWHAFEVVMTTLKAEGVPLAFARLQLRLMAKKDDLPDYLVKHVKDQGGPAARPALLKTLESKSAAARLAALTCLGELGTGDDIVALEKVASDTTKIRGWPGGATIGSEARAAIERLRKKR